MPGSSVESDLLTRKDCEQTFHYAQQAARERGVTAIELLLEASSHALTRFANNAIHQNVAEQSRRASVRVIVDGRTARAATNRLDRDSLSRAVDQAIEVAKSLEFDPDLLPLAEPRAIADCNRFFASTAECSPEERARVVAEAIGVVESAGQTTAGAYSTAQTTEAILNSRGVFAYHSETLARFSITAMTADSSGWAKASSPDRLAFDPLELARRAALKAELSRAPREIMPGRYTVILEPAAVLDLVGQMFGDFSATALEDRRSFLAGRLNQKLFGENINISDDVYHPLQAGPAFDGEGVPRRRLALVENGVPREVAYSRAAARRAGVEPTGHGFPVPNEFGEAPVNIVMQGGDATIDDIIASTDHGILVTRLWYIREVDPFEKIMTGMTRDGTFLIEAGRVACGVRNFRFNQSLIELLNNVDLMMPAERAAGEEAFDMVAPGLRARNFNFTEVTRF
ncbi:MAG TPA: TldD/PmbA family protein [Bryobacteraceae bacterium]|jgi:PmbA protein|nr:TldD/PmbA family protein [Bryobacteraceae bacterium]